jgi:hypothetical protein
MSTSKQGFSSNQQPGDSSTEFSALSFIIKSMINKISTATLVQVKAVTNSGGDSPVGFVDIIPLVNQIDSAGNAVQHGVIYGCPYMRIQGGTNAIILDPQAGDIGIAIFADRDISSVVNIKARSNPGSRRRFDYADALYVGGVLNGTPTQFVEFQSSGITITSPNAVIVNAPQATINSSTGVTLNTPKLTVSGDIIDNASTNTHTMAQMRSIYNTHIHGGVTAGISSTGAPSATE